MTIPFELLYYGQHNPDNAHIQRALHHMASPLHRKGATASRSGHSEQAFSGSLHPTTLRNFS
jgi:hypothetical protein